MTTDLKPLLLTIYELWIHISYNFMSCFDRLQDFTCYNDVLDTLLHNDVTCVLKRLKSTKTLTRLFDGKLVQTKLRWTTKISLKYPHYWAFLEESTCHLVDSPHKGSVIPTYKIRARHHSSGRRTWSKHAQHEGQHQQKKAKPLDYENKYQ